MDGILYICGTPIGNLEDITIRTLNTLKQVDLIAAEDTRVTIKLLNHFDIKIPLTSYHEHNKFYKGAHLLELLKSGKNIALVSDAGMPGISDPGEDLIKLCYEHNIKVTSTPGATAVITAVVLSGLSTKRYVFEGFLPKDKKQRKEIVNSFIKETRTIVLYESPHQLQKTLEYLQKEIGNRKIAIIRELTKKFEQIIRLDLNDSINYFKEKEIRGEFVLVIEGADKKQLAQDDKDNWNEISIEEHLDIYMKKGIDKKQSMKLVAKDRGLSKRDIYNSLL